MGDYLAAIARLIHPEPLDLGVYFSYRSYVKAAFILI